mgnify:CR=1 FL=1
MLKGRNPQVMFRKLLEDNGVLPDSIKIHQDLFDRNGYHVVLEFATLSPAKVGILALLDDFGFCQISPVATFDDAIERYYVWIKASLWGRFEEAVGATCKA